MTEDFKFCSGFSTRSRKAAGQVACEGDTLSEVLEFRTLQAARLEGTALSVCGVLRAWRKYMPCIPLVSHRSSPSPRVLPPSHKAPTCNRSGCVKQLTGAGLKTILLYGRYI